MSDVTPRPELPGLPTELQLPIVASACCASASAYCALSLTSRQFRALAAYSRRIVPFIVKKRDQLQPFLALVSTDKDFASSVTFLWISLSQGPDYPASLVVEIIRHCHSLDSLVVDEFALYSMAFGAHPVKLPSLRSITVKADSLSFGPFTALAEACPNVHELNFIGTLRYRWNWTGTPIRQLPKLRTVTFARPNISTDFGLDQSLMTRLMSIGPIVRLAVITQCNEEKLAAAKANLLDVANGHLPAADVHFVRRRRRWTQTKLWIDSTHDCEVVFRQPLRALGQ